MHAAALRRASSSKTLRSLGALATLSACSSSISSSSIRRRNKRSLAHLQTRQLSHTASVVLVGVVGIPAALLSIKAVLAVTLQNKLIYQSYFMRRARHDPSKLGFASVEQLTLHPPDSPKIRLHGYHFMRSRSSGTSAGRSTKPATKPSAEGTSTTASTDDATPLLLYFQGNGGNIDMRFEHIRVMSDATDADVLAVSYRGYGESNGRANERGIQKDADTIFDYACEHYKARHRPLIVFGHSLGGAVSLYLAQQKRVDSLLRAVILENTFTSVEDMVHATYPRYTVYPYLTAFLWNHWPSVERIREVTTPILFLSGELDPLMPPAQMRRLHANAKRSRFTEFASFARGTHNNMSHLAHYKRHISAFVDRCLERDSARKR